MRLGMIGTGNIAARHLSLLGETDTDVEVVAHLSRNPARAEAAAAEFGGRAYQSLDALLDEGRPDAVIVTVPPAEHGAIEDALIAADVPFLVEKPIGLDKAVPTAINERILSKGLVAAVGYNWRALDTLGAVREQLATTPLRMVLGRFHVGTPAAPWWRFEAQSGGQMVEQACHMIDLARHLAGEGRLLGAAGSFGALPGFSDGDVAGASAALLQFGTVPGVVTATCVLPDGPGPELRLICEGCEIVVTLGAVEFIKGKTVSRVPSGASSYTLQNRAFFAAVRQGDPNAVTCSYSDALGTHRLAIEIAANIQHN